MIKKTLFVMRKEGLTRGLHDLAVKGANLVFPCKILKGVTISKVDPAFLSCPHEYSATFLSESVLRKCSADPEYEMSSDFLNEALSKGDECYAICDGETLAAYGWYSTKPTRIDLPGMFVHFGREYVYMYKGFTHTRYRGQRLHAIGMSRALQNYRSRGFRGLVSYVESNNFASLKSCARMGYAVFGTVYVGKSLGRYFQHSSRGCEEFGFHVGRDLAPIDDALPARAYQSHRG